MDVRESRELAERSIWRHRGRRVTTGMSVAIAVALAAVLAAMINILAADYPLRRDVSRGRLYALSDKTIGLLRTIQNEIEIHVIYSPQHESCADIRNLLAEYTYAARHVPSTLSLRIRYVDPDRDLADIKEVRRRFAIEERNVIVFSAGSRFKVVRDAELYLKLPLVNDKAAFGGEALFSSALQSISQARVPILYAVQGHGERDLWGFDEMEGYSQIGREILHDNIELRPLVLANSKGVPADADALLIAGPTRRFSDEELGLLRMYLARNGRAMILLDPYVRTGLDDILQTWGLQLQDDMVVDMMSLSGGRDFYVGSYEAHPITERLRNVATLFSNPRSIEPAETAAAPTDANRMDKPKVTRLALTSENSWAKRDPADRYMRYQKGVDRKGPVTVAAAVEKGVVKGIPMELKPTRLVVLGDSDFVSNALVTRGVGGNRDFFLAGINWLLAREPLMAISAKVIPTWQLAMTQPQVLTARLIIIGALPALVAVVGLAIWARRRR